MYFMNLILIYTTNIFSSITYIKQVKIFTVNYPDDVSPKYIFYIMERLLFLIL